MDAREAIFEIFATEAKMQRRRIMQRMQKINAKST